MTAKAPGLGVLAALTAMACAPPGPSSETAGEGDAESGVATTYGPWVLDSVPALPRGEPGTWDSGLVDPGAMTVHMGRYHMLYNGIPSWPHPLSVGWATSSNGRTWQRQTDAPVFAPDPVPFGGWTVRATSVAVEDGRWALYFVVGGEGRLEGVVGRAIAPAPEGPWTVDPDPVLEPGPDGAWDSDAIGHAKVLPDAAGYVMYYTGSGDGQGTRIGRAVSSDGIVWTKDPGPVFAGVGADGGGGDPQVSDPTVVRTPDGGWLMVYRTSGPAGRVAIAVTTSPDGVAWSGQPSDPVASLEPGSPLSMIFFNNMLASQAWQSVYFEGESSGGTDVWVAVRGLEVAPVRQPET